MSFLDEITVLVLTYNEEANIGRTLAALSRFSEIVVLDSGSTDGTRELVTQFANARFVTRTFDQHATQWNYGLKDCGIGRPWVLALDADHVLSPAIVDELAAIKDNGGTDGYITRFRYRIFGRPLSAALYPPRVVLYRRQNTRYVQDGHTQRIIVDGTLDNLCGTIDHDDRKPLSHWLASQQKYAKLEAEHLLSAPRISLGRNDRIRLTGWAAPLIVFFYTLIAKRCILHGWAGWFYVLQRTLAEIMIALEIIDRRAKL